MLDSIQALMIQPDRKKNNVGMLWVKCLHFYLAIGMGKNNLVIIFSIKLMDC